MNEEEYNLQHPIFNDNFQAITFGMRKGLIEPQRTCVCGKPLSLMQASTKLNGYVFSCNDRLCRKVFSISKFYTTKLPAIPLTVIFKSIYCFVLDLKNFQAVDILNISEPTYIKLKNVFIKKLQIRNLLRNEKIGGENAVFQVDETAVCRRRLVRNPSSELDEIRDTVWLIGIINENNFSEIRLEVLPNRRIDTLTDFFQRNINPGSIIKSDGYPSYPQSVANINCFHVVVNHNNGFINVQGDHTNFIENIWSHFKTELRSKRGILYNNLSKYIVEFVWRKINLKEKRRANFNKCFIDIVDSLLLN